MLAGCSAEGCTTYPLRTLLDRASADGTLTPYQIEATKRDFCEKFRGQATFAAGQTGTTSAQGETVENLPSLLQPYLRVTINGQSAEMNDVMLRTMQRYLQNIKWPSETDCQGVLVLSENSLLLEFPNLPGGTRPYKKGQVYQEVVSISSAWQKGADRVWRLLQVHMSQGEVIRDEADVKVAEGAKEGDAARSRARTDIPGW
ncbi:MAG: hypothetical protein R2834_20260 [Rhodothermales bacterium]